MRFRNLSFLFGFLALIAVGTNACNQTAPKKNASSGVEYYRSLLFSETPFDIEKGSHPLTTDEAANINSYKFTYDENDRLLSVEFVRGDELLGYSSMEWRKNHL